MCHILLCWIISRSSTLIHAPINKMWALLSIAQYYISLVSYVEIIHHLKSNSQTILRSQNLKPPESEGCKFQSTIFSNYGFDQKGLEVMCESNNMCKSATLNHTNYPIILRCNWLLIHHWIWCNSSLISHAFTSTIPNISP